MRHRGERESCVEGEVEGQRDVDGEIESGIDKKRQTERERVMGRCSPHL